MKAGDLRHRITIQQRTLTPDGLGGHTETWSELATVWAAVWPVSAKERIAGSQVQAETTHRVRIRYLEGVLPQMRILFGSRLFEIDSIINTDERMFQIDLLCTEGLDVLPSE